MDLLILSVLWNWCPNASQGHLPVSTANVENRTNLVFVTITLSRPPTPSNVCDTWVRFQLISFICLLTALEAVLVLRGESHRPEKQYISS
jgi:hypothetical protein